LGEVLYLLPQRRSHTKVVKKAGLSMPALLQDIDADNGSGQAFANNHYVSG